MESYVRDLLPSNIVIDSEEQNFNIKDEEMRSIIQQRMDIMKHNDFTAMINEFKIFLQEHHYQLDELVRKKSEVVSSHEIQKSTQAPMIILTKDMATNSKHVNPQSETFFKCTLESLQFGKNISRHTEHTNCLVIPLKKVLFKFDCKRLHNQANKTFQYLTKEKTTKNLYTFQVLNVFNISANDHQYLRDEINKFVTRIFSDKEDSILSKILLQENTRVLMIVNNELLHQSENKIDEKNMVGVIIFGAHDKHGYVIDYIAIDNSYRNNSFGPLLINMSQIFSSMIIKNMSFGKRFKKVYTVFLACIKKEVGSFYDSIGFTQQLNTDIFKSGNDLSKIGDRLKYETWNSPDDESCHLSCYSIY